MPIILNTKYSQFFLIFISTLAGWSFLNGWLKASIQAELPTLMWRCSFVSFSRFSHFLAVEVLCSLLIAHWSHCPCKLEFRYPRPTGRYIARSWVLTPWWWTCTSRGPTTTSLGGPKFFLSRCQFFVDILALHFRQLIKQSQSEGEAIGRSITNTFKTRFKKILDSSQVQTLSYDETGILTATFLKNSCDTESLKETQKMDMLERLLYKQGQHCKAGTRVLKCCKYPHHVHVWTFLCILFTFCQKNSKNFSLSDMDAWLTRKTGSIQASHMVAQQRKRKAAFDWFLWLDTALPNISL